MSAPCARYLLALLPFLVAHSPSAMAETIRFGEIDAGSRRAAAAKNGTLTSADLAEAANQLTAELRVYADQLAQGLKVDTSGLSKHVSAFLEVFREYEIDSWGSYISDADIGEMYSDMRGAFSRFADSIESGYSSLDSRSLLEMEEGLRGLLVGGTVSEQTLRDLVRNLERFAQELQDEGRSIAGRNSKGK